MLHPFLIIIFSFACLSCAEVQNTARKPIPPSGSDPNYIPWNAPQQGEGGGQLGGMLEGR